MGLTRLLSVVAVAGLSSVALGADAPAVNWEWAGWGGGGFFYAAAFHPTRDATIYMGGDVAGVYKSEDHGRSWRLINNGLVDYGVFSLAADRTAPDTVYAATAGGLCKSTDGGAEWRLLPNTGPGDMRITGEKGRSVRCVAVDPTDGGIVYAGTPGGKVYRSADGGETWSVSYQKAPENDPPETLRVQFGKANDEWFGGFWLPFAFPEGAVDCTGFGFTFRGDGTLPRDCFLTLKASDGTTYQSRNLRDVFGQTEWGDVVLGAGDFALAPDYARENPEQAEAYAGTPDWSKVVRLDFGCVGPLMDVAPVGKFTRFFFATPGGARAVKEFAEGETVRSYGNLQQGSASGNPVYSVAVADKDPSLVIAATDDSGLMLSSDAGQTWRALPTPQKAVSVAISPSDPDIIYGAFGGDGIHRSTDGGETWQDLSAGLPDDCSINEVAVSPTEPQDVYAIGSIGWDGAFLYSTDGGQSWIDSSQMTTDPIANPTLPGDSTPTTRISAPRNLAINPENPQELFIAGNWRPCASSDGGRSWTESVRGADISCVHDLRFHQGRTYAAAMDEGVLVSEDNGKQWRAIWPLKWDPELSGHSWRLAISDNDGVDHIVSTCSPWDSEGPNRVVVSPDGGKTITQTAAGLPTTNPTANTMWGRGYPRAMAADPSNPNVLYLGIDGDPSPGNDGGGIFKSEDGGLTWKALPAQPGSRRMFHGLAVDPTDSRRLYWAACGAEGGLWRTDDGGASWEHVFRHDAWVFNVQVTADGTVYCPGKNLWRSTDHGQTWEQITQLPEGSRVIVALETDPADPKRIWFATTTWDGSSDGAVFESVDGGATWQEITGDLPYRKPLVLRYNPETQELWAAGVCVFKCRR